MSFLTRTFSRLFGASAASTTSVSTPSTPITTPSTPSTPAALTKTPETRSTFASSCFDEDFFAFAHDQDQHQTKTITTPEDEVDIGMSFVLVSDHFEKIASFDNDEVCCLGDFASLAYLDRQANVDAGGAAYDVTAFATDISSGYVRTQGRDVVLTYKGTDTATDFMTDFNAWPTYNKELLPEGFIHRGFLLAFQSSWPQVEAALNRHAASQGLGVGELHFTVCGHSLGAAQATLAALKLAHLVASVDQVRLLTFGSPRVFSWAGAAYFERLGLGARTLRVAENGVDPVTMVNLGSLGFKHVGLNLRVEKPASAWPHLMEGYMAGFMALTTSTFVPSFPLGSRRTLLRLLRLH